MGKLIIRVVEVEGKCPVYKIGDEIVLDEGFKLNTDLTDSVCMHSLSSILPYHIALYNGVNPVEIGLARKGEKAYVQCLDPCKYTGGGTVTFEIRKTD